MKKYIVIVFMLCIIFQNSSIVLASDNTVSITSISSQINKLKQQRDALAREIEQRKKNIDSAKKQALNLNQQINTINSDINSTERKISNTQGEINNKKEEISKLSSDISQKENEKIIKIGDQKDVLRTIYTATSIDPLFLLISDNNLSEAIDRSNYIGSLEFQIENNIEQIVKIKNDLVDTKSQTELKQKELENLQKEMEGYKRGLEQNKRTKNQLLTQTKNTQRDNEQLLAEAKKAYSDVNSELYKTQQSAQKRSLTRGGEKRTNDITFSYPFGGTLTTNFGDPTPFQSFHTGIDIDGVIGDPILAAADGKITLLGGNRTYGYGQHIIIDHGSGISSLYGHLDDYNSSLGDTVKRGQVIGFMGNTGFAIGINGGDGSHLHFEIREDNIPVNPFIYLP